MNQPIIFDKTVRFDEDHTDGPKPKLVIHHQQDIPDDFIANLKRDKITTNHDRMGEFVRVATIPVGIVEKWLREGYDIHQEPIQKTLAKLRKEDMDAFITTNKRI